MMRRTIDRTGWRRTAGGLVSLLFFILAAVLLAVWIAGEAGAKVPPSGPVYNVASYYKMVRPTFAQECGLGATADDPVHPGVASGTSVAYAYRVVSSDSLEVLDVGPFPIDPITGVCKVIIPIPGGEAWGIKVRSFTPYENGGGWWGCFSEVAAFEAPPPGWPSGSVRTRVIDGSGN